MDEECIYADTDGRKHVKHHPRRPGQLVGSEGKKIGKEK